LVIKTLFLILLAVLVLVIASTLWRVGQNAKRAADQFPPQGAFVEVDGHPVHYVEMGQGPALVLIHGASGNTRDFTFGLAEKLATSYRVIIFDRPGLGYTPQLAAYGVSITDQANLLASAAVLLGAEKPIVAGQSFGGSITLAWAVTRPDNIAAAVSISGASHPWEGTLDTLTANLAHPVVGPVLSRLASAWVSRAYVADSMRGTFNPQDPIDGYAEHIGIPLILRPASLMANARQRDTLKEDLRAISSKYSALTLPLEIVHGDADPIVPLHVHSTRLLQEVEGANLVTLAGIGHMPQHLNHSDVIAAIDRAAARAGLR
jgi:pimeloyl-ACP methyl ester carboxylesterase